MKLTLAKVAEFVGAQAGTFDVHALATGYSIDSRTIKPGDLFFAIKGENFDGHDFVDAALAAGAVAAVVRASGPPHDPDLGRVIVVPDTLVALQRLALAVRKLWGKPLVGVTGSAGKTTTKEAIAHVLAERFRVLKSEGNLNNHYGLPLQLLRLEPEHEIAVIEMGMNHLGEIAALCKIAEPNVGVVTNVAPVHLGFFESVREIAQAKYELVQSLPHGGTAVLNADDEYVSQFGRDFHGKVVLFGIKKQADVCAANVVERGEQGSRFDLVVEGVREPVQLPLLGRHNIYNALAAAAVAAQKHMTPSEIAGAFATIKPAEKRGQVLHVAGATVINDCYNSNPKALEAMMDALASLPAKRHIVVAGEMLELGTSADALHYDCGALAAAKRFDMLIGVRGAAKKIVEGAHAGGLISAEYVETPEAAGEWLASTVRAGDAVLLKASRGVRLERALEKWQSLAGTAK
ncbi:MAG: UDP-N-acetylmuramoyl-tripeptide--D-alanyl-D-alanine ligase [Candidatus Koribacter versatilis]|uniref:UDP-N-acetylmuramoyl-tripeptide--D-alanyl-D-alanine ligase n=1 Tax=Candidatus Korobacter versatilis TaxID=658062 RepID=A0A932EQZ8_9BACT|nr:UDP-N-acetylmuramoyl-tripeptide--D-alanyl-D-alanine ligase [Candidatus Koribacter versatilis]